VLVPRGAVETSQGGVVEAETVGQALSIGLASPPAPRD
jgi:hypothetical protein